jgi:ACR3 family arsenite efflux pump ArsB
MNKRESIIWALSGAALALMSVYFFSHMQGDPVMRMAPELISVTIAGGIAGVVVSYSYRTKRFSSLWLNTIFVAKSILIYFLIVFIGFAIGRLGPFVSG